MKPRHSKKPKDGDLRQKTAVAELAQWRARMDRIDDEMIQLILKRIELSTVIMKTKPKGQITDSAREKAIVRRYFEGLSAVSTRAKVKRLVQGILRASRYYPEP